MVDRAVAEHLEILRVARGRGVGVGLVEGVSHAHAFDRFLGDAVDHHRRLDARGFEDGRHDVDHVMELRADAAGVLDVVGPGDAMPCRVPPKCDATCLVHLKGVSNAQDHATDICG